LTFNRVALNTLTPDYFFEKNVAIIPTKIKADIPMTTVGFYLA